MQARTALTRTLAVVGAWLPLLGFWVFFFMSYGNENFGKALTWGLITVGSAAILGLAVWWFCGRQPWPSEIRLGFYAKQFTAASIYAAAWLAVLYAAESYAMGKPILELMRTSRTLPWHFVMGLFLYGLVAGASYGIQTRRRAAESERRALRAEASLSAARLDALRSRLNPHFLFNALHTVGALVRSDGAKAENAVEKLGDMLRYTLREDPADTVKFREEWEFTERYLEFERLRFAERLRVARDIDPRAFECATPAFALQTLVENAVRHSIAGRVEGGCVRITARVEGATFVLKVRDDGGGTRASGNGGQGIGLKSLKERLEAVYGGAADLAVSDDGDSGFEVALRMPCAPPRPDDAHDG